jgi:hypothetical protein
MGSDLDDKDKVVALEITNHIYCSFANREVSSLRISEGVCCWGWDSKKCFFSCEVLFSPYLSHNFELYDLNTIYDNLVELFERMDK